MLEHAAKLRIDESNINRESFLELLQKNPPQISEGLVRIECAKDSELSVAYRPFTIENEAIDAITVPSPIWPPRVAGTNTVRGEHTSMLGMMLNKKEPI